MERWHHSEPLQLSLRPIVVVQYLVGSLGDWAWSVYSGLSHFTKSRYGLRQSAIKKFL